MASRNKLSKLLKTTADMGPYPSRPDEAQQRRYRAEEALGTLTRAEEIRRDKKLMRDVKDVAAQKMKTLQSVSKTPSGRR